jgi:hypothetical protein
VRRAAAILFVALAVGTALVATLASPEAARAGEAKMVGLHLDGPPGAWRSTNRFVLEWQGGPEDEAGYEFVDAPWAPAGDHRQLSGPKLEITIPSPPGAAEPPSREYTIRAWLYEHQQGARGPIEYVTLRFDDAVPPPAQPSAPAGWIDGRTPIVATIEHPSEPLPASGLRGYAAAVGGRPGESPCAAPTRCDPAEIDLPGGVGDDRLPLGPLPDGVNFLNVVAVSNVGLASAPSSVPIRVDADPPRIHFEGLPAGWVDHPVAVTAIAEDPRSGTEPNGPSGPFTALAVDGGVPAFALGGSAGTTVSGEGAHQLRGWARDAVGNADGPQAPPGATVRIDETPPRVAFAPAQRPEDPELIEVAVADELAGPSAERGTIELRRLGATERYQPLPTRVTASGLVARWSSDDFAPGAYEFRATGFDAAGNSAATKSRADGSPMVLRNPVKVPTAIESGFGGASLLWQHCHRVDGGRRCHRERVTDFKSRPALWTVPYGRSLRFGGVLRTASGAPLAGQPVAVLETFAPGTAVAQRRTEVTSRGNGRFDARLAPGPSRRIEAFFPGTRTLTRAAGRPVTMAVRAGLRLQASTEAARIGGEPVIFSGRLLAAEATIPRTGRPIVLQFRVPGGAWSEFRTVQTDRRGRFRYSYAFTDDDSRGIRFQFRAVSPEQSDWPYRPSTSRPVAVTGY